MRFLSGASRSFPALRSESACHQWLKYSKGESRHTGYASPKFVVKWECETSFFYLVCVQSLFRCYITLFSSSDFHQRNKHFVLLMNYFVRSLSPLFLPGEMCVWLSVRIHGPIAKYVTVIFFISGPMTLSFQICTQSWMRMWYGTSTSRAARFLALRVVMALMSLPVRWWRICTSALLGRKLPYHEFRFFLVTSTTKAGYLNNQILRKFLPNVLF